MKKLLLILMVAIGVLSMSAKDTYSRDVNVLPKAAQTTLKNNFKAEVSHIKIDKDWGRISEYDVILTDGSEISFDRDGNWKEVEMRGTVSVPSNFIPAGVAKYVKQNQKNVKIVGIEKERKGYKVDLSNGVEMEFNNQGQFIRYDD